jgi:hypothetical protein
MESLAAVLLAELRGAASQVRVDYEMTITEG